MPIPLLPCFISHVITLLSGHMSMDRTWVFLSYTYSPLPKRNQQVRLVSHSNPPWPVMPRPSRCWRSEQQASLGASYHKHHLGFCSLFLVVFRQGLLCLRLSSGSLLEGDLHLELLSLYLPSARVMDLHYQAGLRCDWVSKHSINWATSPQPHTQLFSCIHSCSLGQIAHFSVGIASHKCMDQQARGEYVVDCGRSIPGRTRAWGWQWYC